MNRNEYLLSEIDELEKYFFDKNPWSEEELMNWYIKCIEIFEAVNLRATIIDSFSALFNTFLIQSGGGESIFSTTDSLPRSYKLRSASIHLLTIKTTFAIARKKIETMEEEERLIPSFILKHFESTQLYNHIYTALKSLQKSIGDKNVEGITTSANTLLDSILDYVDELKGKQLKKKIDTLYSNPNITINLGFDKEVITAFNYNRIIRNIELVHPKENVKQSIPFITAVSYAYLVVFQLKLMLSLGYFNNN